MDKSEIIKIEGHLSILIGKTLEFIGRLGCGGSFGFGEYVEKKITYPKKRNPFNSEICTAFRMLL